MPATINIFAAGEPLTSPTLKSATLSGITPDGGDDKDDDTNLRISLFVDYGGGFVQTVAATDFQAYGRFADRQPWGPLDIPVKGTFTLDNVAKLKGRLEFQPNGDDTWRFTYTLNLNFSDGTVISKEGSEVLSDDKREIML